MSEKTKSFVQSKHLAVQQLKNQDNIKMAANSNNKNNRICELQADRYKNVREFFKHLKIKAKMKKTLGKIWFNKQCLIHKITPNYAKITINIKGKVATK